MPHPIDRDTDAPVLRQHVAAEEREQLVTRGST